MTIGRADADRAGARPYLRRRPSGSILLFLGLHTQKQQPSCPFLESVLDRKDFLPIQAQAVEFSGDAEKFRCV